MDPGRGPRDRPQSLPLAPTVGVRRSIVGNGMSLPPDAIETEPISGRPRPMTYLPALTAPPYASRRRAGFAVDGVRNGTVSMGSGLGDARPAGHARAMVGSNPHPKHGTRNSLTACPAQTDPLFDHNTPIAGSRARLSPPRTQLQWITKLIRCLSMPPTRKRPGSWCSVMVA